MVGDKRESPQLGALLFSPALEEGGAVLGKDGDRGFVEDNSAVVVAEFAYAHEVVLEGGHDFGVAVREVQEYVGLAEEWCCLPEASLTVTAAAAGLRLATGAEGVR